MRNIPKNLVKRALAISLALVLFLSYSSQALAGQMTASRDINIDRRNPETTINPPSNDNSACKVVAGVLGGAAGAFGSVAAVGSLGSAAGLGGGAAITSGLAGLGATMGGIAGGAMVTGLFAVAAIPALTATVASLAFCHEQVSQTFNVHNGDNIHNGDNNNNLDNKAGGSDA